MNKLLKFKLSKKLVKFFSNGDSSIYTLLILAVILSIAYSLTGGILPRLDNRQPSVDQNLAVDKSKNDSKNSLQLSELKGEQANETKVLPQACTNKLALNLILDVSASMHNENKIEQLNKSLNTLVNNLSDDTIIGATIFAGLNTYPDTQGVKVLLPFTKFNINKDLIKKELTTLKAGNGSKSDGTYMRNAFLESIKEIKKNQTIFSQDGYKVVTILFTDGVPEIQSTSYNNCVVKVEGAKKVCFAKEQDPRPDISTSMKSLSKVYSIGIFSGERETQPIIYNEAIKLLIDIASDPSLALNNKDSNLINNMFDQTLESFCLPEGKSLSTFLSDTNKISKDAASSVTPITQESLFPTRPTSLQVSTPIPNASSGLPPLNDKQKEFLAVARSQIGKSYDLGSCNDWSNPKYKPSVVPTKSDGCRTYDCSNFAAWVYYWVSDKKLKMFGLTCSDYRDCYSATNYFNGPDYNIQRLYTKYSFEDSDKLKLGDLVYFGSNKRSKYPTITHVGIYIGSYGSCGKNSTGIPYKDCIIDESVSGKGIRERRLASVPSSFVGFLRPKYELK